MMLEFKNHGAEGTFKIDSDNVLSIDEQDGTAILVLASGGRRPVGDGVSLAKSKLAEATAQDISAGKMPGNLEPEEKPAPAPTPTPTVSTTPTTVDVPPAV